jgi:hypothetical protein
MTRPVDGRMDIGLVNCVKPFRNIEGRFDVPVKVRSVSKGRRHFQTYFGARLTLDWAIQGDSGKGTL